MQFAFVFPGQGSQFVGMLSNLAEKYPIIEDIFYEASTVLGYDLWKLTKFGPVEELNNTLQAQPALLTSSVALWRVWRNECGKIPTLMAGHSLGEYSALVCAEVISFQDALYIVKMRGKFMQEAVPYGIGAMSAIIGLNEAIISNACEKASENQIVLPVNYNAPDQIVIAGHKEAVYRAVDICKSAGAKRTFILPISVPSHCSLMKPAAEKLAIELEKITFNKPTIPIINNVDVKCEISPQAIRDALVRQLYNPVQWIKIVEYIASQNIKYLYEAGPGRVLTGFTKRIVYDLTALAINEIDAFSIALSQHKEELL